MLQVIRDRLTGWFAALILGVIALALVLTFGNIDTGFSAGGTAASVNGEDIAMNDFRRLYQRQRQQWESTYRAQMPDALANDLADQVIDSLVRNRAVVQHVSDAGYRVSTGELVRNIQNTPAFQVGGQFSQPAYESLLASEGMNVQRYEFELRKDLEVTQFLEGIGYSAFFTPSEFRRYIQLDGESRDVDYVLLRSTSWADKVSVTDEQVTEFYETNQPGFMTEESVALEYIEISYESILADIDVADEEARDYFASNPQEFSGPDERQAAHILILRGDDEAAAAGQAEELKQRLDAGEDFAELAAEFSADSGSASNGGDLGWLGLGDSPAPEFEEVLFTLAPGEVSEPVRTEFGYHLIRLSDMRAGKGLTFEDVREDLVARLRENAAADLYGERVDELDERALESFDGLAPVAEAMGEELGTVETFTRNGGLPLGFEPELVSAVFSLEVLEDGENSPVIDLGEGRAVVVRVTEYRESEVRPLEDVRELIVENLEAEAAVAQMSAAASEVLDGLNSGAARDAVSLPEDAEWQIAQGLRRGAQDLPPDLTADVFRAPRPASGSSDYRGLLLASGEFALYRVTAVTPGTPNDYSQDDRDTRKRQLAGRLGGGQATAAVETLVADAKVEVADDLLGLEGEL